MLGKQEILALLSQGVTFLLGMVASIAVGMMLSAHVSSPEGLIIATIVAGIGILGSATVSQAVHDRVLED